VSSLAACRFIVYAGYNAHPNQMRQHLIAQPMQQHQVSRSAYVLSIFLSIFSFSSNLCDATEWENRIAELESALARLQVGPAFDS
jgi:hypothetical protein